MLIMQLRPALLSGRCLSPQNLHELRCYRCQFRSAADLPQQLPQIIRQQLAVVFNDHRSSAEIDSLPHYSRNCVKAPGDTGCVKEAESRKRNLQANSAWNVMADFDVRSQSDDHVDEVFRHHAVGFGHFQLHSPGFSSFPHCGHLISVSPPTAAGTMFFSLCLGKCAILFPRRSRGSPVFIPC